MNWYSRIFESCRTPREALITSQRAHMSSAGNLRLRVDRKSLCRIGEFSAFWGFLTFGKRKYPDFPDVSEIDKERFSFVVINYSISRNNTEFIWPLDSFSVINFNFILQQMKFRNLFEFYALYCPAQIIVIRVFGVHFTFTRFYVTFNILA